MVDKRNILLIGRKDIIRRAECGGGFCDIKRPDDNNDIEWQIINAVEFGDSGLSESEIADDISKACFNIKERLTQVLFIFSEKLNEGEVGIYNTIKKRIFFDDNIAKYTTIVRIVFNGNFVENEGGDLSKKIGSEKIVYLNFPSLVDAQTEEIAEYKNIRERSRKVLIDHLKKCESETYGPNHCLKLINTILEKYLKEKDFDKKLDEKRKKMKIKNPLHKNKKKIEVKVEKEVKKEEKRIESSLLKAVIEIKDAL